MGGGFEGFTVAAKGVEEAAISFLTGFAGFAGGILHEPIEHFVGWFFSRAEAV